MDIWTKVKPTIILVTHDISEAVYLGDDIYIMRANPGVITEVAVNPNKLGVFKVRCAELCGLLHAYMQNKVYVQTQEDYNRWLATQPKRDFSGAEVPTDNTGMNNEGAQG